MAGHDAALSMHQRGFGIFHLALAGGVAELIYRLGQSEHGTGIPRMTVRQQTAIGIHRQRPVERSAAFCHKGPGFTLFAKTEIF